MGKNHVGRPTNEELALRKRKQIIKVLLPLGIIIVGVIAIIGSSGLKGLQGNSIEIEEKCEYVCPEGWDVNSSSGVCTQLSSNTTTQNAYIIGDIDGNGVININDYDELENYFDTAAVDSTGNKLLDLDERQEVVYDVDGNKKVDEEDAVALSDIISSSATAGVSPSINYVCPNNKSSEDIGESGESIAKNTIYTLNNGECNVVDEVQTSIEATCKDDDNTEMENTSDSFDDNEEDDDVSDNDDKKSKLSDGSSSIKASEKGSSKKSNKKLCKKVPKPGVKQISEPCPNKAIKYWASRKVISEKNFIYKFDKNTGLSLGAWPKNYKKYPKQLSNPKTYHKYYIWPITPLNGIYKRGYPHKSMDIQASFGSPVYSPVDGIIISSEWGGTKNLGSDETSYTIEIKPSHVIKYHKTKIDRIFMTHLSGVRYRYWTGSGYTRSVKKGQLIGFSGNAAGTSKSVGWAPHLHLTFYNHSYYGTGLSTSSLEKFYKIKNNQKRKAGK